MTRSLKQFFNQQSILLALIAVGLLLGGVWFWFTGSEVKLPPGVAVDDYQRVAQTLRRLTRRTPGRDEVLFKLGEEFAGQQKWDSAAALFSSVSHQSSFGRQATYLRAQTVLQLDRLRESEQLFREYLAASPVAGGPPWVSPSNSDDRKQALHYLSYLLALELRNDERRELLGEFAGQGDADLFDTLAFHFQSLMEWNNTHAVERIERACEITPSDWQLQAVLARYRIAQGRLDEAWTLLQKCREELPSDLNITAYFLTCLEERGDRTEYLKIAGELPVISDRDPVNLLLHRGQIALRQDQVSLAVTHFQQALARDPAYVPCRMGLAQAWMTLKLPDRRKQELTATQDLVRIQNRLGWAASKTPTPEVLLEIARLSADAGLKTAAADVCRISIRLFENPVRFQELLRKIGG